MKLLPAALCSLVCAADGARDANSRYLLAQCCMQMGKLPEAEHALTGDAENDGVRTRPARARWTPRSGLRAVLLLWVCWARSALSVTALCAPATWGHAGALLWAAPARVCFRPATLPPAARA